MNKRSFYYDIRSQLEIFDQIRSGVFVIIKTGVVKTYNPSANQRRAILNVGMESSFLAIRQDGEQIVHTQGTGVVLVYVWRWSSHIEISGKRPIRSGLGIVV